MPKSVRIVAVADTHSRHQRLVVPDGDVFIHAGDLTRLGTREELEHAIDWIAHLPHETKIVVAGNHDAGLQDPDVATKLLDQIADATYLCNREVVSHGLRFWGAPWTPRFGSWSFMRNRGSDIAQEWQQIPEGLDVLITHGPAFGFGDRVNGERVGCGELARAIQRTRPRWHLCGHIHEDHGLFVGDSTVHANVTTGDCREPATVFDMYPR